MEGAKEKTNNNNHKSKFELLSMKIQMSKKKTKASSFFLKKSVSNSHVTFYRKL